MHKVAMRKAFRLLAVGGVTAAVLLPGAALAQDSDPYGGGGVLPTVLERPGGSVQPGAEVRNQGGSLPFTGADVVGLAVLGAGAVAGGAALVRTARRRTA